MNQNVFAEYLPYLLIIVGLTTTGVSTFLKSGKSGLKQTGIPVDGIVFKQDYSNASSFANDKITVRFITHNNEWITGVIEQAFGMFYTGQYENGETVKIFYDKEKPSNFYVDTNQSEWMGRLVVGVAGIIFTIIGLYILFA